MNDPLAPKTNETGRWMALIAALLGWMFDGAEMGVFSMVGRAAVQDLIGISGKPTQAQESQVGFLFGVIIAVFLVGAATGGVLFGWLGDRIGRVRAMSLSVLTYALFTGFCGFARTPLELGVLRFIASLGMGGEWSLGVALVMEVWPNRSRALMAGLIGAAANAGYLLVGVIGIGLNNVLAEFAVLLGNVGLSESTVQILVANKGWRLMMMLGTVPALLTFFFRIFVPESEKWLEEKAKGSTSNWATSDLIGVLVGATGPVLIIVVWAMEMSLPVRILGTLAGLLVAGLGYLYPVYQFLRRDRETLSTAPVAGHPMRRMLLGAGLSAVALLGTWGSTQWAATWAGQLTQGIEIPANAAAIWHHPREYTQIFTAVGAIVGTILAALMGDWFGRRLTYAILCVTSIVSILGFYQMHDEFGWQFLIVSFVLGAFTASFYGWLPLYLPELFPTRLRATGQGFGFNFGRILAAIGTLQIGALIPHLSGYKTFAGVQGGYAIACSFGSLIYVLGIVLIAFAPETKGRPLPE